MIFFAGLAFIIAGWIVQVLKTCIKREQDLSTIFLVAYGVGCILLSAGNFVANDFMTGVLNSFCVVLVGILLIVILVRKKMV